MELEDIRENMGKEKRSRNDMGKGWRGKSIRRGYVGGRRRGKREMGK